MVSSDHAPKKVAYFSKLNQLCEAYSKILIVQADHVGSRQMAEIRLALRGKAVMLMGKNTMIRTALRGMTSKLAELERLIPCIKHNIGLIFCIVDPSEVRKIVVDNKVPAPARQGAFAPVDVIVPAGPTSLDPSQTSFFQALGIATKLVKGQIEIQSDVHLIRVGEKVSASQSALLKKLNIMPFNYGLAVLQVYDQGSVYDALVLDITNEDLLRKFAAGVQNVAAFSRQIGLPNEISISHSIVEAFKFCTAAVLQTEFVFPEMSKIKEILENPEAFVAPAVSVTAVDAPAGGEAVTEEAPAAEEEAEEDGFGFDLFG